MNTDWDQHNWIAFRNRTQADKGFEFICWDTESIFESLSDNKLGLNTRDCPSGIFMQLMHNRLFQNRYMDRAHQLLTPPGMLSPEPVIALWDSLYNTIASSLYAEAARWGDYRRDVHPYQTQGDLYTPDDYYLAERQRLLNDYFPYRSERVLNDMEQMGWYSTNITPQLSDAQSDNSVYDLQGRRVQRPARRGIYIRNKKLIIH